MIDEDTESDETVCVYTTSKSHDLFLHHEYFSLYPENVSIKHKYGYYTYNRDICFRNRINQWKMARDTYDDMKLSVDDINDEMMEYPPDRSDIMSILYQDYSNPSYIDSIISNECELLYHTNIIDLEKLECCILHEPLVFGQITVLTECKHYLSTKAFHKLTEKKCPLCRVNIYQNFKHM
jgi:hypothetical protein